MSIDDTNPSNSSQALNQLKDRVTTLMAGFSKGQRTTLAVAGAGVVALVLAVSWFGSQVEYAPLYTNLQSSDVGVITKKLAADGVDYQISDGGSTVQVPKDQVYQLRADLAETTLPSSGKVGYGVLDDQGLTTSEFGQRVGFQRAMEGEMSKTIEALDGVSTAVVHLAIPKDQVFALDAQKPTASVMVKTTGTTLASEQVEAIRNIVSSGIEGMTPDNVSVADSQGHVLAAPGSAATGANGSGADQLNDYESRLANQIEALVSASVGPGKVKATVSADLNFDQTTQTKETYEPSNLAPGATGVLPLTESTKTETYGATSGSTTTIPAGQLGSPNPGTTTSGNTAGNGGYNLSETERSNAVNKTSETINKAVGTINRLTIAVMVDEKAVTDAQVAALQQLVSTGAGIDTARGDAVVVTRMPFDQTTEKQLSAALKAHTAAVEATSMPLYAAAGGIALLIAVATFLVLRRRKKDYLALEALAEQAGQWEDERRIDITQAIPAARISGDAPASSAGATLTVDRREVLGELIDNQPDEVAQLLRGWLADRRTSRR